MSKDSGFRQGIGFGLRMGVEMLTATLVGALIGYGLDYLLGTEPWLLAVFLMLGGAAGCLNVYRAAMAIPTDEPQEENNINKDESKPQTSKQEPRSDRKL